MPSITVDKSSCKHIKMHDFFKQPMLKLMPSYSSKLEYGKASVVRLSHEKTKQINYLKLLKSKNN